MGAKMWTSSIDRWNPQRLAAILNVSPPIIARAGEGRSIMSNLQHQDQILENETESMSSGGGEGMAAKNATHDDSSNVAFCHNDQRSVSASQPRVSERLSFAHPIQPSSKGFSFIIRGSEITSNAPTLTFKTSTKADREIQADIAPTTATSASERGMALANDKPCKVKLRLVPKRSSDREGGKSSYCSSTVASELAPSTPYSASPASCSDPEAAPSDAENEENDAPDARLASTQPRPTKGPVLRLVVDARKLAEVRLTQPEALHRTNRGIRTRAAAPPAVTRGAAKSREEPMEAAKQALPERPMETTNTSTYRFATGAERKLEIVKCLHAMVTEASQTSQYRNLLRWSDDGSFVHCDNSAWNGKSMVLEPLFARHFSETVTFTNIRRRFREQCGAKW
jgi:pyruvate/2-oxoglutarate dehydrogenase complex dihydrolipoamide acyltransferase (E2) component